MEAHESAVVGQKCSNKEPVKDKAPLQRKWASEPCATTKRSTFADPEAKHRESLPCGASGRSAPQQKYAITGNSGKLLSGPSAVGAVGGPPPQDPQGPFAQGFPRGYSYQLGQPYPQHPQTERFHSGAKPQPGLEPHAWPFVGQLPSDDLYPVGHPGHTHPHGAGAGRFSRQKSPSLPSSFRQYSQSGPDPGEEGYSKKEQKPKKPGKYICHYCGRACAKPSVLKKHIRSHTGERPYPCVPCGFSFKTKSNLYKHRKSHAHAIKAGLVPFSELAVARSGEMDQASPGGEAEVHSDGEQSTDTDEEGVEASTMLTDKDSLVPQISFKADKSTGVAEPPYADSAEELPVGSMKVPILIIPKPGGVPSTGMACHPFQDMKGSHHMLASQAGSPTIKERLSLRLNEKKGQDSDSVLSQSLNLLSPHSKGSTDSGYFSRSESAEQQISPPNTNVKTYEEIMFGRTWYYRPNSRSRQSITVGVAGADPGSLASLKQSGAILDMGKIAEDHICFRGDVGISGDPKQYPTRPCQSSTGLLEPPSDSGPLIRSNSVPTSSPPNLSVPPGIRGSHSFDEMMTSDDVFYPPGLRRLQRQAAFEHSTNEPHVGEAEGYGYMPKNLASSLGMKIGERSPYGTRVSMSEIATRKRRKEKSVGDEEDSPGQCDSSCSSSVEMIGDYEFKQSSLDGSRATLTGKGSLHSAHSQSDSFDTCNSMCSEDIALFPDSEGRKAAGNVISVIQHTNSLSRPNSFEKSESFEQPGFQPSDKAPSSQYSEQSDTEIFEDALSPESALLRTESMEQQLQSDSDLASLSSSSAAASPGQPYHIPHKLVRQPNIQVPEIRVTEEPDKPEKDTEAPMTKEPEKQQQQHVEEFQLPQRSDTLSQMPSEKLPPKKKRLRLADIEHSSGESSFESTCTSLSRSPSQESNLSHSSSFSMSFDRDEGLKSASPTKQDDSLTSSGGAKQSEFLTVPGSGHSSHHQQREMRRSSSEQAPCTLPTELPEMRSKSFDYGSLSSSRQGEVYSSASAMKERRRGYLVRQASLSVYPEAVIQEPGGAEMSIKQESLDHGVWPGPAGSLHSSSDVAGRTKRAGSSTGGVGSHQHQQHHQHLLQQSISEDSLQDEPLYGRSQQYRLQAQGSSSEGELPGHEAVNKEVNQQYQSGPPFISFQQPGLFWSQEAGQAPRQQLTLQAQQQIQKLHIRSPGKQQPLHPLQQIHDQHPYDGKSENPSSQMYPTSFSSRTSPLPQQQQQNLGCLSSKLLLPSSTNTPMLLQQIQPIFATQNLVPQSSLPGMLVPVRIQTHVPSFGTAMYTSVSQLIAANGSGAQGIGSTRPGGAENSNMSPPVCVASVSKPPGGLGGGISGAGFNLSHLLGQTDGSVLHYPLSKVSDALPEQRLNTGIPLSLTSGTISTTDASGSGIGGSKRMLSPASSLELFIETKQQKRVKEERMYGQIVKEMSAVELSGTESSNKPDKGQSIGHHAHLKSEGSMDDSERMSSSPPLSDFPIATKIAIPVRSSAPHLSDLPRAESFTPPLQIVTDRSPVAGGRDSPEELDVDDSAPEPKSSPQSVVSSNDAEDTDNTKQPPPSKMPVNMLVQLAANQSAGLSGAVGQTLLLTDITDVQQFFRFPSLRTMSRVSWCFLNYTKPNNTQAALRSSVYSSWCVSSYNPNPLNLSTKAALALLRSKQRRNINSIYTTAAMSPPSSGKLVSSVAWKLRFDQLKPELMPVDVSNFGRKMKGVVSWDRLKEEQVEKEVSVKQPANEPIRIKIFEGGYKSNEDYVYVRGRGRGKYICEECGIRCKKPSMLKKHIRTHTDVRPYVCKFCNFAFKTKGNLTKHMKSKAHMKKCLELGVSMSSVEDTEADEGDVGEEGQKSSEKISGRVMAEHQFSDADDSEGGEEDGDEVDDEDDEDDDYDGDSTPKTRSRSTSPQPYSLPSLSITAVAASHSAPHLSQHSASDLLGNASKPPLFGYFTTVPSIQITPQAPPSDPARRERSQTEYQRSPQRAMDSRLLVPPSSSMDEDLPVPSPDLSSSSSRLSSPGLDHSSCPSPISPSSSPSARRYLSPRRDLSPRAGHLSPRRDISPLRHISPKRDLGAAGGYRRDLSPRRGHLSLLSPLSRPISPAGRDYKRDLSPRGRNRGMIWPVSPRRGLHQHLHHQSQQTGARGLKPSHQPQEEFGPLGHHRTGADMEMEHLPGLPGDQAGSRGNQSSPPHQGLFSHLPLHSQLQVRSPYPMIPIGGIQMVHSVPTSVTTPLAQQGAQQAASRLVLQKSTSEDSITSEAASPCLTSVTQRVGRGGAGGERVRESSSPHSSLQEKEGRGVRQEQEESIQTCTKAIASLYIDSEEPAEGGGGSRGDEGKDGGRALSSSSSPSLLTPDSQQQQQRSPSFSMSPPSHPSPSPPQGPRIQHFSSLELRPPHPSIPGSPHSSHSSSSTSPHPPSPGSDALQPPTVSKPHKLERDKEAESTKRNKDVS
uniref:C2H2-type domain-containing protein n=1 Tax=Monopterus albus TaxID=43700 RepID=A0A3Q3IY01_MONAL|nr:transcription factor HIVEP2 [Monopterus albus]XP_020442275.1 transcription factor HIVEP2 [Monopterus albus]XP_020442277.1 transcription factor HIVEP2 [Monopterus albus]XP_020442278.1 transcription factor HIVEP2 [Monopterus albus]XP_020442279.1 transcription factor HIVEP2 [Monopterus albus]XP_020442280.1 transcription factor HIVEP2 [Monopterus albus]XP_020442281.1 transcription factor HIVEP2 [Monopterus albus]XP_020442282.1 transcription factor HIVEP2 [Monopterus albus]XP_020442283.1 tran